MSIDNSDSLKLSLTSLATALDGMGKGDALYVNPDAKANGIRYTAFKVEKNDQHTRYFEICQGFSANKEEVKHFVRKTLEARDVRLLLKDAERKSLISRIDHLRNTCFPEMSKETVIGLLKPMETELANQQKIHGFVEEAKGFYGIELDPKRVQSMLLLNLKNEPIQDKHLDQLHQIASELGIEKYTFLMKETAASICLSLGVPHDVTSRIVNADDWFVDLHRFFVAHQPSIGGKAGISDERKWNEFVRTLRGSFIEKMTSKLPVHETRRPEIIQRVVDHTVQYDNQTGDKERPVNGSKPCYSIGQMFAEIKNCFNRFTGFINQHLISSNSFSLAPTRPGTPDSSLTRSDSSASLASDASLERSLSPQSSATSSPSLSPQSARSESFSSNRPVTPPSPLALAVAPVSPRRVEEALNRAATVRSNSGLVTEFQRRQKLRIQHHLYLRDFENYQKSVYGHGFSESSLKQFAEKLNTDRERLCDQVGVDFRLPSQRDLERCTDRAYNHFVVDLAGRCVEKLKVKFPKISLKRLDELKQDLSLIVGEETVSTGNKINERISIFLEKEKIDLNNGIYRLAARDILKRNSSDLSKFKLSISEDKLLEHAMNNFGKTSAPLKLIEVIPQGMEESIRQTINNAKERAKELDRALARTRLVRSATFKY